jgi:hypothetical protein
MHEPIPNPSTGAPPTAVGCDMEYVLESEKSWCSRWSFTIKSHAKSKLQCPDAIPIMHETDHARLQQAAQQEARMLELQGGLAGAVAGVARGLSTISRAFSNGEWGGDE